MKIPSSVIAIEMVKASSIMADPRFQKAVTGGLMGAAGGGTIQLLRRLFQSRRDAEEEGEPSIMKGMLLGGMGGAGLGAGMAHLMRDQDPFRATNDVMSGLSRGMGRKPGMVPYRDGMAPAKFREGRVPFAQGLMPQAQRDGVASMTLDAASNPVSIGQLAGMMAPSGLTFGGNSTLIAPSPVANQTGEAMPGTRIWNRPDPMAQALATSRTQPAAPGVADSILASLQAKGKVFGESVQRLRGEDGLSDALDAALQNQNEINAQARALRGISGTQALPTSGSIFAE